MFDKSASNTNLDSVDAMMITDNYGKIMYSVRYNPRFCKEKCSIYRDIVNKNILEVYPSLTQSESTIFQCIQNATPIYNGGQKFYDAYGIPYFTENLTIPIIRSGKLVGVVELSKDITSIEAIDTHNPRGRDSKNRYLKKKPGNIKYSFDNIITRNERMLKNISMGKMIADSPSSVLIYGETGTGKDLFVQSIHNFSHKADKPFIAQNCAAIPDTLFESILFGTAEGAYTGATNRPGLFEQADGGTLFLDEINSMPISLQVKLLRAIQDCRIRRLGDNRERKVNVRIMAAMNESPRDALKKKHIREDLFFRVGTVIIRLPPLRERKEDIALLVKYYIDYYNKIFQKKIYGITENVNKIFMKYDWPGNIRELQHVIESSMNFISSGNIKIVHLPIYFRDLVNTVNFTEEATVKPLNEMLDTFERETIRKALNINQGNISKTAESLNVPRQTLQYKVKKYKLADKN